jgi:hypothetical protein
MFVPTLAPVFFSGEFSCDAMNAILAPLPSAELKVGILEPQKIIS